MKREKRNSIEWRRKVIVNLALKRNRRYIRWKRRKAKSRREECERNRIRNLYEKKVRRKYYEKGKYKNYKKRHAPKNFSIIGNHEDVITFCNHLKDDFRKRRKVFVNMESVEKVTNESLALLVSNMMLFRNSNIDFNGNFPQNLEAQYIVMQSGFLEQLYRRKSSVNNVNSAIYTHSSKFSNSEIINSIIKSCSKFLWGEECTCGGVYNAMIELMQNTIEHADEIEGKQKWWVTVTKDEKGQKVTFSFLDYGRGIVTTLKDTQHKNRKSIVERLLSRLQEDDPQLLKEVMEGALCISEKGGSQFGNGLNSIYQDMQDGLIENVIIISNKVYADVQNDVYQKMNNHFQGTFVSWEINKNTKHEPICSNAVHA